MADSVERLLRNLELFHPDAVKEKEASSIVLHSGIDILDTATRRLLTTVTGNRSSRLNDLITGVPGMKPVESDYWRNVQCAEYVFLIVMHERWSAQDIEGLYKASAEFLITHGYQAVDIPEPGDIACYGESVPELPFGHFGIYLGEGSVRSKFGDADVFDHPWYLVSSSYGDKIFFFRKAVESQPVAQAQGPITQ